MKFNADMFAKMREATKLLQTEGPAAATAAIQRALQGAPPDEDGNAFSSFEPPPTQGSGAMRDINPPIAKADAGGVHRSSGLLDKLKRSFGMHRPAMKQDITDVEDGNIVADEQGGGGRFISGSHANAAGTRSFKLYIPGSYRGREDDAVPLVVMLHGCKQNPDDFAAGTRMNELAEHGNFLVVYPAQAKNANGSNCWNWFQAGDQQRERGEPSIIADIVREIARTYHVDAGRVYVAGLSAGGAMASVVANAYPELFAAVGIHSGLPRDAAHDIPSAFAVMQSGMPQASGGKGGGAARHAIPVIVFHGDADRTVHPRNGDQALAQFLDEAGNGETTTHKGEAPGGRSYTRTVQHDQDGKALAEKWLIHGAGHAWSGGSRKGSFTDPKGPDASKEMLRFFYAHAK